MRCDAMHGVCVCRTTIGSVTTQRSTISAHSTTTPPSESTGELASFNSVQSVPSLLRRITRLTRAARSSGRQLCTSLPLTGILQCTPQQHYNVKRPLLDVGLGLAVIICVISQRQNHKSNRSWHGQTAWTVRVLNCNTTVLYNCNDSMEIKWIQYYNMRGREKTVYLRKKIWKEKPF